MDNINNNPNTNSTPNVEQTAAQNERNAQPTQGLKFCKHCGQKISEDAVICTYCGRQVEEIKSSQPAVAPQVIVNNQNTNVNTNVNRNVVVAGKAKDKWVAFVLCLFLGWLGVHKFYEGKIGMGILYLFTMGLFGIGVIVDLIVILTKPNPYYV